MNKLFILVVAITTAFGSTIHKRVDPPVQPCQTMAQWEGRASEWDHITENNNRFLVSFDGVGLRKRVLEERKSFMPGRRFYEYIQEYKTNTLYTINLNYNTCTVTNLTQPWQNHTIPSDATMEDEYEIGSPGSGFKVREWSDRLPARRAESWIGIFTIKGCWPIVEVFTDDDSENPVSLTTRFFDLSEGIKNMSVFIPPSICGSKYETPYDNDSDLEFQPELTFDPPLTNQYVEVIVDSVEDEGLEGYVQKGWNYLKSWF